MDGGDRIRLFCALLLPDDARAELGGWAAAHLHGGRLVRADDLHVTLAFLGPRPAGDMDAIAAELRGASRDAASLELRPRRYRETGSVGMIELDDRGGAAAALAADLQERLERLGGYHLDARPWLPHVTVQRFRRPEGDRPEVANMRSIHVVRSALYRSQLGPGGARYDALATAALGRR